MYRTKQKPAGRNDHDGDHQSLLHHMVPRRYCRLHGAPWEPSRRQGENEEGTIQNWESRERKEAGEDAEAKNGRTKKKKDGILEEFKWKKKGTEKRSYWRNAFWLRTQVLSETSWIYSNVKDGKGRVLTRRQCFKCTHTIKTLRAMRLKGYKNVFEHINAIWNNMTRTS